MASWLTNKVTARLIANGRNINALAQHIHVIRGTLRGWLEFPARLKYPNEEREEALVRWIVLDLVV